MLLLGSFHALLAAKAFAAAYNIVDRSRGPAGGMLNITGAIVLAVMIYIVDAETIAIEANETASLLMFVAAHHQE